MHGRGNPGFGPPVTPPIVKSLIIATEDDGTLQSVGRVGSGINARQRAELNAWLWSHLRSEPLVPCGHSGKWVEPGLYCTVSYLERTRNGELRAPVFKGLITE